MCLKNVIDLFVELVFDLFLKYVYLSKNGKVSFWRICGVFLVYNILLYLLFSGVLVDEGFFVVIEVIIDFGFICIFCINYGGSYSIFFWFVNRWCYMFGLVDVVGYYGYGGLLEFNSSRVWMSYLFLVYNEGYFDMLIFAFVKKYDLNSWIYWRNFCWLFVFFN